MSQKNAYTELCTFFTHLIDFDKDFCFYSTANNFLKLLASQTGGRFHKCHSDFDAQLFAHKLLTEGFGDTEVRCYNINCQII